MGVEVPWTESSVIERRREFAMLFEREGANRRMLCRRFGISRQSGYELARRYREEGEAGLADRSRRPHRSPARTSEAMERLILELREEHPCWGGRKLARRLRDQGHAGVPSASTVTEVLRRRQRLDPAQSAIRVPPRRFERLRPNELWQMDFKSAIRLDRGCCHALTVLDDHSRFALGIRACPDETEATVRGELSAIFRRYGLPEGMLMDNGSPWGSSNAEHRYTRFEVWLMELGVRVRHGGPYHPQTQGKDERFHRTLAAEAIGRRGFADLADCQRRLDCWREVYNTERPHEAIDLATPITRYQPSRRAFPERIEVFDYGHGTLLRRVGDTGWLCFKGRRFRLGRAFIGRQVALRPALPDGSFAVLFCGHQVGKVDPREPAP